MSKIQLKTPDSPYSATVDTEVMEVEITEAFNGIGFVSPDGERLSVCMRDVGFEVRYRADFGETGFDRGWVEFKEGAIKSKGEDLPIDEESNFVTHARRELELMGEEPDVIEMFLRTITAFMSYGHSGGSAAACIPVLHKLLCFENLTDLTDDPEEWMHVAEPVAAEPGGVWQSRRRSDAFSNDGGKTYYLLSEMEGQHRIMHNSMAATEKKEG